MGNPLFGVDISGLIRDYVGTGVLDATLIKSSPGTRTPGNLTGGTNPTSTSYACKGFIDEQGVEALKGTLIPAGMKLITLIGDTINSGATAVGEGDQITIEGSTYEVEKIDRDPAAATYTCICRPI